MKRILLTLCLLLATLAQTTYAQTIHAMRGKVPGSYNFWLALPNGYSYNSPKKPLVVFLHGRSLCGTNLNRVRRYGPINAIERGLELDAFTIAPQNPGGSWKPAKIMQLVEYMERHYNIDSKRIYVLGMSLGGYGTMDFVGTYPDRIAAAMAMCGGTTLKSYEGLSKLPLWIVHGTADAAVPVTQSRKVANGIRTNYDASRLLYSELPGINHGRLARLFYQTDTYDWLFAHSLDNRTLNRSYSITSATVNQPYGFNRKRNSKVIEGDDEFQNFEETADASDATDTDIQPIAQDNTSRTREHTVPSVPENQTEAAIVQENKPQSPVKDEPNKPKKEAPKTHKVKAGDTLYSLARRYKTTVERLQKLNGLKDTNLRIGQVLKLR